MKPLLPQPTVPPGSGNPSLPPPPLLGISKLLLMTTSLPPIPPPTMRTTLQPVRTLKTMPRSLRQPLQHLQHLLGSQWEEHQGGHHQLYLDQRGFREAIGYQVQG